MKLIKRLLLVFFLFPNYMFGQNEFEIRRRIQESLQDFVSALSYVNDEEETVLPTSIAQEYGGGNYFVFNGREMKFEHFIEDYCHYDLQRNVVSHTLTSFKKIAKKSSDSSDKRWDVSATLQREYATPSKTDIADEDISFTVQWRGMYEPVGVLELKFQSKPRTSGTLTNQRTDVNSSQSSSSFDKMVFQIFFGARETDIADSERGKVENVVNFLKANPEFKVMVTGYADARGGNPRINMFYSQGRAERVAKALEDAGIDAARITVVAKGETVQYTDGYEMNRVTIVPYSSRTSSSQSSYVDLGLPSGTLWKDTNESGGFYTYEETVNRFGDKLPTKEQCEELKDKCQWTWNGSGYNVTGLNGNSIFLPAAGFRDCDGDVRVAGSYGGYWSSSPGGSERAWYLHFFSGGVGMTYGACSDEHSVRLVQRTQERNHKDVSSGVKISEPIDPRKLAKDILSRYEDLNNVKERSRSAAFKSVKAIRDDIGLKLDELGNHTMNTRRTESIKKSLPSDKDIEKSIGEDKKAGRFFPNDYLKKRFNVSMRKVQELESTLK